MTEKKKTSTKKKALSAKKSEPIKKNWRYKLRQKWHNLLQRRQNYLRRRPHRSFRLTRRRDYKRSLKLPGYLSLTAQFLKLIKDNWRIFLSLTLIYVILTLLMSSAMSQSTYSELINFVSLSQGEDGAMGFAGTLSVFWSIVLAQLGGTATSGQSQVMGVLIGLFMWLTVVWLLRAILAGKKPKARDGLYLSGGPVLALLMLVLVAIIQLLPAAIAIIVYGAAQSSMILDQTAMLMLFGGAMILLITMSLYWVTSTFFAMIIVSLPGIYPMEALRLASEIVVGRRIRILLRLMWLIVLLVVFWAAVLLPVIIFDGFLKSAMPDLDWLPLVPSVTLLMGAASIILSASYIYLFYRKVVDDDAKTA